MCPMKKILPLMMLFTSLHSFAQNYQCLQSGVKHYFINGNGYLRGIRIDSVRSSGAITIYYPFHTPRGPYNEFSGLTLYNNGGSWLGKKVQQQDDGTFIFDSYWGDSVIIKTQAHVGDSWTFYQDTSNLYYRATVISTDTMTVLSSLDSIKRIMINAYIGSSIVTTDAVDSFVITLSKNHGFVEVFDLYTFPYHKPDSTFRAGLDFFLDRSTCNYNNVDGGPVSSPNIAITLFKLVQFINPNDVELHSWSAGDIIQSTSSFGLYWGDGIFHLSDTIASETTGLHSVTYTIDGTPFSCPGNTFSTYPYPCTLVCNTGTITFYDSSYSLYDSSQMPEEHFGPGNYLFYFPNDTSYCSFGPLYLTTKQEYNVGLGSVLEMAKYKLGIGKVYSVYEDGEPTYEEDRMMFHKINGLACGDPLPSAVPNIVQEKQLQLYPNPTQNELTISSTTTITHITIANLIDQTLYNNEYNTPEVKVNVAGLSPGLYLIRINDTEVRKFVKE